MVIKGKIMHDKLYVVTISTTVECEEPFSAFIDDLDSEGWSLEQHPESDEVFCRIFFSPKPCEDTLSKKIDEFLKGLRTFGINTGSGQIIFSILDREDWQNSWRSNFKTFSVDNKLFIKPKWEKNQNLSADQLVIETDPGIVFGSGEHPTTNFCLKLLTEHSQEYKSFLDIGCGSGILCVAAAKLGADRVFGFDNDPVSVSHALRMSVSNGVGEIVKVDCLDLDSFVPKDKFDFVIANLFAEVIIKYKEKIDSSLNPNGLLALTGILSDKSDIVEEKFCSSGYRKVSFFKETEWSGFLFRRQTTS